MENMEEYSVRINTNELLAYQRDLKEEKELLQKMLAKIEEQVNRLQVEQLQLLGLMNKSLKGAEPVSRTNDQEEPTNKSLDLSVATAFKHSEEEIEDEDEDEI